MRRRLWMVLLVVGMAVTVRPVGRRVKRFWLAQTSAHVWNRVKDCSAEARFGEPCAWLSIPRAGIDQLVIAGAAPAGLSRFPCREQVGAATLIMAHRDTHFQGLENLQEGDRIDLALRGCEQRRFRCLAIHAVEKNDVEALIQAEAGKDRLLLLTCYPFRHIGPAPRRFLVVAGPCG